MTGEVIGGRYELRERLGSGAMAEVWLAQDRKLERLVALKLVAPHADIRRFEREARAAAALSHPNVARIYEYGKADGRTFMALEFLPGGTLEERLRSGSPLPDADTERIARQLAAGLAHAHAQGLVHRDLKPANVLFDEESRAKIADFGIARLEGIDTLTEAGTVMGTAAYISPEQAAGEPATPASDVYSFGVILYRLLTGRLPFEAESALQMAAMHRTEEPTAIASLRPDAPVELAALAAAAMAKDPLQRPADGAALVAALDGTAQTAVLAAPPEDPPPTMVIPPPPQPVAPQPPRGRRRLWIAAVTVAAALLAAAGIAAAVLLNDDTGGSTTTPATTRRPPTTGTTAPTTAATPTAPSTTAATTSTTTPTTTTRPTTTEAPTTTTAPPPPTTTTPPPTTDTVATTDTLPEQP